MRFRVLVLWRFSDPKCSYLSLFLGKFLSFNVENYLCERKLKLYKLWYDIEYFNTTLEEYKIIYPNETSDYIINDGFDSVRRSFFCK